jgi:hypothetical protein
LSNWLPQWLRATLILGAFILFLGLGVYKLLFPTPETAPVAATEDAPKAAVNSASTNSSDPLPNHARSNPTGYLIPAKPRAMASIAAPLLAEIQNNTELAICGLTPLEAAQVRAAPNAISMRNTNAALAQPVQRLLQSAAPADQALGLYMQVLRANWQALDAAAAQRTEARQNGLCQSNDSCAAKEAVALQKSLASATQNAVMPLVKLALAKNDPSTYAAAVYACNIEGARDVIENENGAVTTPAACAAITVAQWAAIDSDNAVPWLLLAAQPNAANAANAEKAFESREEQIRSEQAVVENAISRALAASDYTSRYPAVNTLFDEDNIKALPPFAQATLAHELLGLQHSLTPPQGLSGYCSAAYYGSEKRRLNCGAIANKIIKSESSLAALLAAIDVGKALKWDSARLIALRDESLVATQLHNEQVASNIKLNCENVATLNNYLQRTLRYGERAVGRELLAKSGKTVAQLMSEDVNK